MAAELDEKVALVTGGGTGIGKGIAKRLASAGASVALAGFDRTSLEATAGELSDQGHAVGYYVGDVRVPAEVESVVASCTEELGAPDIVINNAGLFPNKPAADITEDDWDVVIDTNLKGSFLVSQAACRRMSGNGRGGRIVNISSTAATIVRPGVAHYGSSKAGIVQLTKALAVEWGALGVTVNCVQPGIIQTEEVARQRSTPEGEAEYASRLPRIPLGKFGEVEDVASAVLWLVGPHAGYCTGSVLTIDGGYSLGVAAYK